MTGNAQCSLGPYFDEPKGSVTVRVQAQRSRGVHTEQEGRQGGYYRDSGADYQHDAVSIII